MFILDVAHDFLKQVLHRDETGRPSIFIGNRSHLHMFVLHELKDLDDGHALRHDIDFTHDGAQIRMRIPGIKVHQFADMDHAQNMVTVFFA